MFLKNRNISSEIRISKVTDYAALKKKGKKKKKKKKKKKNVVKVGPPLAKLSGSAHEISWRLACLDQLRFMQNLIILINIGNNLETRST